VTPSPASSTLGAGLGSLFDLPEVYGSFLVTPAGSIAARAIPELLDDVTLAEVGGRIIRLGDTFQTIGVSPDLCVLRFTEHKLYVKTLPVGVLCIVTGAGISLPALRMAANLVARKVAPEMSRLGSGASDEAAPAAIPARPSAPIMAAVPPPPPPPPAKGGANGAASSPARMYRGRPIG
jgi:predicted regulator of Ras-like GTPase activity (Roadblock/LC7/MglB family)